MSNKIFKALGTAFLLAAPLAAISQKSVTYDFAGTVLTEYGASGYGAPPTGIYANDTGTLSGTFSFTFSNANPVDTVGTISNTSPWVIGNYTGSIFGSQIAPGLVFSITLDGTSFGDLGLTYASALPAAYESISGIQFNGVSSQPLQYTAQEGNWDISNLPGYQSGLLILSTLPGNTVGLLPDGLPVFRSDLTYLGFIATGNNGVSNVLYFTITSLRQRATQR